MRKYLLLFVVSMIAVSSFAGPVVPPLWDKPLRKAEAFTDPYVMIYAAYDLQFATPYHRVRVDVEFDQTVEVPYYAVVRVYGDYNNGDWYRDYTLYLSGAQWRKSQEFPLQPLEEIYTEVTELVDYGPQ